jgi:tRNA 2-thiouridine synthesizing protein A
MIPDVVLDAGDSGCSELVMLVFQTMKTLTTGQVLEVHAYDPAAYVDLAAWCRMTGNPLMEYDISVNPQRFFIQKKSL